MIGRVLKTHLIQTQNMFKFDLKTWVLSHKYISTSNLRGKLEKLDILFLQFLPVGLYLFLLGKIINPFVNYWCKQLLKIACFLDECLRLLELLFKAIISSHLVQETLQKSEFVVNGENTNLADTGSYS